jgi:phosphate acyltransferase
LIIALDGDRAPEEIVLGALQAAPLINGKIELIGQEETLCKLLKGHRCPSNIDVVHANEAVGMDEKPLDSYRKKKDSSLRVGANRVRDGQADILVSAGNTGAAVAACQLTWRQFPGIHRPAILTFFPGYVGQWLLLDAGASVDVDPQHLFEYALMGRAYAEKVLGRKNPSVHLLNIGEEEGKGNHLAKEAYKLLKQREWFRGNIEGKEVWTQPVDVVVCDAFVGNIFLKTSEGVADLFMRLLKDQVPKSTLAKLPYLPLKRLLKPIREKTDWAEVGGSPLLGLNGLCIIAHGRSDARAIKNAVLLAQTAVEHDLLGAIRESVCEELQRNDS